MRGVVTALREQLALADCSRRRVAAIVVKDGEIIGRGHNTLPSGSCLDGQCPRGKLSYAQQPKDVGYAESGCTSTHAEVMALTTAITDCIGATVYITEYPCPQCDEVLNQFEVAKVVIFNPETVGKFQAPV